ncbi:MAG: hypothetical protein HY369_03605 [Candidatus Aenigmarchaeota archaeon]|nr:hypothetical protein [Candidatus Aenigmarchaeota archaeon]
MASLKSMSVADLRRELERREKGGKKLQAQHAKLAKRLAAIDAELAELGVDVPARGRRGRKPGPKPGRKRGRPAKGDGRSRRVKNAMTLLQAILKGVPTGKTVSPAEAATAAKAAGYRSAGQNFGQQVATCLSKAKQFKRRGRGQYQRVGGGGGAAPAKAAKVSKGKPRRKPGRPKGSKNKPKTEMTAAA